MYGWVLYIAVMVYPSNAPAPYYYQPHEAKVSFDFITAEDCFKAQAAVYTKVLGDGKSLNSGWITSAECRRVDIEPKQ